MRTKFLWMAGAGALLVCIAIAVGFQQSSVGVDQIGYRSSQLDTLHARCVQDMVANTCKVMGTGSAASSSATPPKPGELVFIAGVGAVAASDYQQMYQAGDAMCSVVRAACARDWDGPQCLTARKVFGDINKSS